MTQRVIQAKLHLHANRFTFAFFKTRQPFNAQELRILRRRLVNNGDRGFGELQFQGITVTSDPPAIQRFAVYPLKYGRIDRTAFERMLQVNILPGNTLSMTWTTLEGLGSPLMEIAAIRLTALREAGGR